MKHTECTLVNDWKEHILCIIFTSKATHHETIKLFDAKVANEMCGLERLT